MIERPTPTNTELIAGAHAFLVSMPSQLAGTIVPSQVRDDVLAAQDKVTDVVSPRG